MRRVYSLLLAVAWLSVMVVPAVAVGPAALAAAPAPTPVHKNPSDGGLLPEISDCVAIGLPIVPGLPGTCTTTDAEGNSSPGISNAPATGGAIINYLRQWLFLLNLAVPAVILIVILVSGVQYITSVANPSSVKSAKTRLTNAIIALVLYLMMFAVLQFLVPGGIL